MTLALDLSSLTSILLAMTRIVTVLVVAPPFRGANMPNRVRVVLAGAIAFAVGPQNPATIELAFGPVFLAVIYQVVVGALFGFLILMLMSIPLVAGSMIDGVAGLSAASLFDPMSGSSATPAARLTQVLASLALVMMGGHLLIMRGVLRTYEAAPLSGLDITALQPVLIEGSSQLLLAAVEVALPVLVALLLTEAALALAARAAPRLNVMVVGFAVKSLVFVLTFAMMVPLLVHSVEALLERSLRWAMAILGA